MNSNASKEPGPSSSCYGTKNQQQQRCSGPPSIRGPGATAPIARIILQLELLDFEDYEGVAKKNGLFNASRQAEPENKMIVIKQFDPVYPGKWRGVPVFWEGKFLQNEQVREAMGETLSGGGGAAESQGFHRGFLSLKEMCSGLTAPRFPVTSLKHVTTLENFRSIVNEGAIRGCDRTFILRGNPVSLSLSCWSPHIPRSDVESFMSRRFEELTQRYWGRSTRHRQLSPKDLQVRDMLANSPALRPDSRYGNFQFTLRLGELLWNYKQQHCGGYKPALRVLGTEAYTLEVVHWVLIHSPSLRCFDHLPLLDSVWPRSWPGDRIWEPESTTDLYTWFTDPSTGRLGKYPLGSNPEKMYDPSRWNNVVFAFYLPGGRTLNLGRGPLLGRVEACETAKSLWGDSSRILRHPPEKYVSKEQAEYIIHRERAKASF